MQKLTLTVPADVVARAKHKAIDANTSISKEVTEFLRLFAEGKAAPSGASLTSDTAAEYPAKGE